jgi:hypothetical protein
MGKVKHNSPAPDFSALHGILYRQMFGTRFATPSERHRVARLVMRIKKQYDEQNHTGKHTEEAA